jgi:CheY-like chemotaxis protein
VILLDIQLPDMDGLQAVRTLKSDPATRDCKVYALTAYAMKGDEEKFLAAGFDKYFSKPIRYQEFLKALAAECTPRARAIS